MRKYFINASSTQIQTCSCCVMGIRYTWEFSIVCLFFFHRSVVQQLRVRCSILQRKPIVSRVVVVKQQSYWRERNLGAQIFYGSASESGRENARVTLQHCCSNINACNILQFNITFSLSFNSVYDLTWCTRVSWDWLPLSSTIMQSNFTFFFVVISYHYHRVKSCNFA